MTKTQTREALWSNMSRMREQGYSWNAIASFFNRKPDSVRISVKRWRKRNGQDNQDKSKLT